MTTFWCRGKNGLCHNNEGCNELNCEFFDGTGGYRVEIKTNADRIRAMSDEELADWLNKFFWGRRKDISPFNSEKWLKQPVKDGEDDAD